MIKNVKINGLKELESYLKVLPAKLQKNVLRGAMRKGMKEIQKEAKARAPVGPPSGYSAKAGGYAGALRDSIRISTRAFRFQVRVALKAGGELKGKNVDVFYAHFLEWGTAPHTINSKRGMRIGGKVFFSVEHPGIKPRPFMRPALDMKHTQAVIETARAMANKLRTKHGIDVPDFETTLEDALV